MRISVFIIADSFFNLFILLSDNFRAIKFNSVTKWIGIAGGVVGLILSTFMIHYKTSKKAVISTDSTIANSDKREDGMKTLDNIKYLNDKAIKATEESVEQ